MRLHEVRVKVMVDGVEREIAFMVTPGEFSNPALIERMREIAERNIKAVGVPLVV